MESCAIIPQVIGKNGEIKDSRLFDDLLSFTNNDKILTNRLYYITKNPKFKSDYSDVLEYDDSGEVTIKSLIKLNVSDFIEDSKIIENISNKYNFYKEGAPIITEDTTENYNDAVEKAIDFNTSSDYRDDFVAVVRRTTDRNIYVSVEKANDSNKLEAQRMSASYHLNKDIRSFLDKNGISIGALNSLDLSLGRTGVTDFSKSFREGEGIAEIIRIAQGSRGEEVLPEEFSHFIINALKDEPVISRLLNLFKNRNLSEEVLGEEFSKYKTLTDNALANEAVARLFLDSLYNKQGIKSGIWDRLLDRAVSRFKDKFSKMNREELLNAIGEAKNSIDKIVDTLPLQKISIDFNDRQLSHIDDRLDKLKKLLKRIQDQEIRRYHVYKSRTTKKSEENKDVAGFQASQREFINILEGHLMSGTFIEGILFYLKEANDVVKSVKDLYEKLENPSLSFSEEARILREISNYIGSYKSTLKDIRDTLGEGFLDNEQLGSEIIALTKNISENLERAETNLNRLAFRHFNNFLKKYFPEDGIDISFGKRKQHIGTKELEDLLKHTDNDPTIINIWLDSAAESTDIIIKLTDYIIKKYKEKTRNQVIDLRKRIYAMGKKLRDSGINNEDFMFEKDSNGNYTFDYVSEINWAKFREEQRKMYRSLDEKYGKDPEGDLLEERNKEKAKWYKDNLDQQNLPNSKYRNKNFLTGEKLEYYKEFMKIRKELLDLLPPHLFMESGKMDDPMRAIQVRKDFIDRMSGIHPDNWWNEIKTSLGDSIFRREDDTEYGTKVAPQDFSGKELMSLPIFFTKKLDKASDLSHDTISTLIMFADMAYNYSNMSEIVDSLEVGRTIMTDAKNGRTASDKKANKPVVSVVKEFGKTVTQKLNKSETNFAKAYNNLLDTQLYGRYLKDEGTIGSSKVDTQKAASLWNKISSLNQLALSGLAAMAAVAQDISNVNTEAIAGEFFTAKDLLIADKTYFSNLPSLLKDIGSDIKTSKLALFIEKFDILHDYENEVKELSFGKNKFKKAMSTNSLYFMLRMGSHWGETRTALAQAFHMKLKDSSGNTYNLWDVLEKKPIDSSHPNYGYTLEITKEVFKEDGSRLTSSDLEDFKNRCMGLNQRLYGIYNQADKNALQTLAIGKMAFLYRNWLVPAFNRKFAASDYNMMLDSEVEGYYRTLGRFLWNTLKDLKELKFTSAIYWNQMSVTEKANIKRAITELSTFLVLMVANAFLFSDWDDKENPWIQRTIAYLSRRLQTEIGALAPTPLVFNEFFKIIKSPMAGIEPAEGMLNFVMNVANPWHWGLESDIMGLGDEERLIQSGKYKDRSKLYRSLMESPFVPMRSTILRMVNPEESMTFFNN